MRFKMNNLLELSSFCSAAVAMPIIDIASSLIFQDDDDHSARIAGQCWKKSTAGTTSKTTLPQSFHPTAEAAKFWEFYDGSHLEV